jgi:signal recognition particle subunit SRP54
MLAVRRMGPIANLLGMLPGAGQMKDALAQVDDKHLDRLQAIIRGMTPAERQDPKIINASRRQRIARGSGVAVREVNDLVNRFYEARKMMQQMAGRFGLPGARTSRATKRGKKGKKGKGRGPTQPKVRGGMPGFPGGLPDLSNLPPGLNQLPPGLNDLPPGFDPSKLKFPKNPKEN